LKYLTADFSGRPETLPPTLAGPVNAMPNSPVFIVMPSTGGKTDIARALHL
jgi:hypothetical protein